MTLSGCTLNGCLKYQEYEMDCLLCGSGQATVSIDPVDPRKVSNYDV
jgi:hypothetical protein